VRHDRHVTCEPPDDPVFEADVRTTIKRLAGKIADEEELLTAVADALRTRYPRISIRSRDPIAAFASDERSSWHVLRDGRRQDTGSGPDKRGPKAGGAD
jgi:hypothetical protein